MSDDKVDSLILNGFYFVFDLKCIGTYQLKRLYLE